jgi:pimeloyl-ACP methyl ester carboxylesterase
MAVMHVQKSTIVRSIFWVLNAAAPKTGERLAERLWCTIKQGATAPAARPGYRFQVLVDGRHVAAEAWGSGPTVYLMHGWGGHRAQLDAFVEPLVQSGHRVVALDAPSHGDSDPGPFGPRHGLLTDFIDTLTAVVKQCGPAHAVIAHSLGGAATAIAILDGLPVGRAVLIAPFADPIPYTVEFGQLFGFGERIRTGFLRRLERRVGRPMSDFDIPGRLGDTEDDLPPLLVIHDTEDKEVHQRDGALVAAAWPGAEFVSTTGLGHRRILRDPEVVRRVIGHVAGARV